MTKTVVANFSGEYYRQGLKSHFRDSIWVDLSDIEGTSCYCDTVAESEIKSRISDIDCNAIHWLDSGDYHYMTKLWTDKLSESFSLVLFDNHPDCQKPEFGNILSCGSWVGEMLESNGFLKEVFMFGVDPELYAETKFFASRICLEQSARLLTGLEENVYISIDKDVLASDVVITNWDQGKMRQEDLLGMIRRIAERNMVIGVDICGECPESKGGTEDIGRVNREFNIMLQEYLSGII